LRIMGHAALWLGLVVSIGEWKKPWVFRLISAYPLALIAGGFVMKVRIRIETELEWGECRSHEIGIIERCSIDPSEDGLGISLVEGKAILKEVQRAV